MPSPFHDKPIKVAACKFYGYLRTAKGGPYELLTEKLFHELLCCTRRASVA